MKKLILAAIVAAIMLTGCMGTDSYYRAQIAYYQAQADANRAYMDAMVVRKPLAEMTAPDGTRFVVNQTSTPPPPVIKVPPNPITHGVDTIVNSTPLAIVSGGWAASRVLKASTGDINASGGSTVTSTRNSNNNTEVQTADGSISGDTTVDDHSDSHDSTAEPTIVEGPDPVIVDPVVVDPVVVRPEVVTSGESAESL